MATPRCRCFCAPVTPSRPRPGRPDAVHLALAGPLVGRELPVQRLRATMERVGRGEAQAVFLSGEPGIGKTKLAAEFARGAHGDGAVVLYGRCDEDGVYP